MVLLPATVAPFPIAVALVAVANPALAPFPKKVLFVPEVIICPAAYPKAVLPEPVAPKRVCAPIAVLEFAVVTAINASAPKAVFCCPVVILFEFE